MKTLLLIPLAAATLVSVCSAEQVTYSYTGSDFTIYQGTFTSGVETDITVSFTFAAALGPDLTEASQVTPLSFSISDGFTTLTNLSPNIASTDFSFITDSSGNIISWDVYVVQSTGGGDWIRLLTEATADSSLACGGGAIGSNCSPVTGSATVEYSSNQPGWTESAASTTPEPSAFLLVCAGIAALFVLKQPRYRLARAVTILLGLATASFGEVVVYTTSNSTSVSGGASGYVGYVDDYLGSLSIEYYSIGNTTSNVYFSIMLNLDNNPQNTVSSALLSFGGLFSPTSSGSYDYDYGSEGSYVIGSYQCGFNTCYTYSSAYSPASIFTLGYIGPITLTTISSPSVTWTGSISSGSVDLTTLGFGSDLVNGGTLTIQGYFAVTAYVDAISNDGFNSYNNFDAYYDVAGTSNASLELDEVTPEPGTTWLVAGGIVLCLAGRFRAKVTRR